MSPVIRVSESTYERLQALAKPFVDTPDSVITRLLDLTPARAQSSQSGNGKFARPNDAIELDPDAPGNLAHTRVRYVRFGDRVLEQPNWANLLRVAHAVALEELGSVAALRQAAGTNIREGRYESEGFTYLAGSNISLQGQDSNLSWQNSLRLARKLGVPVEVAFEWYNKESAAHPGKSGHIAWSPENAS
ncbi:MAG TPA: hypothetical protein VHG28_17085 [Longimicrobiaceae bacterium]|nr:hypothetical protein [Longimicrobiaceae bacterium]